jgi:DHA1 family bicyclomycin/chloramphenicol resistance-like MFS transporter
VAPIIGGWLHVTWGWRSVFGLLMVLGLALLLVCALLLPETHPREKRIVFHPVTLLKSCWRVASEPAFLLLALASALSISSLFCYIGSTPAIILERWHLKETQFYYVFIPVVAGFMVASLLGRGMAGRILRPRQIAIGFGLIFFAAIVGVVAHAWSDGPLILLTQLLLFCMAVGAQLTNPVLSLEMLDMHPLARGAAASVAAFVTLGIGAVMMGMIAPVLHGDLALLAWISLGVCGCAWLAWRWGASLRRH